MTYNPRIITPGKMIITPGGKIARCPEEGVVEYIEPSDCNCEYCEGHEKYPMPACIHLTFEGLKNFGQDTCCSSAGVARESLLNGLLNGTHILTYDSGACRWSCTYEFESRLAGYDWDNRFCTGTPTEKFADRLRIQVWPCNFDETYPKGFYVRANFSPTGFDFSIGTPAFVGMTYGFDGVEIDPEEDCWTITIPNRVTDCGSVSAYTGGSGPVNLSAYGHPDGQVKIRPGRSFECPCESWDRTKIYDEGDCVSWNGKVYRSCENGNLGNEPEADATVLCEIGYKWRHDP